MSSYCVLNYLIGISNANEQSLIIPTLSNNIKVVFVNISISDVIFDDNNTAVNAIINIVIANQPNLQKNTIFKFSIIDAMIDSISYTVNLYFTNNTIDGTPIHSINSSQELTGGDIVYIIHEEGNRWRYINNTSSLLDQVIKLLGADDASTDNQLITEYITTVKDSNPIIDGLTPYLDSSSVNGRRRGRVANSPLSPNQPTDLIPDPNKIVTINKLPDDLYKYLDISSRYKTQQPPFGLTNDNLGNKLETNLSINYLDLFLTIMQNYPTFYTLVANQLAIQNSLCTIKSLAGSLITLTYPTFINKSQYFGDIIIQSSGGGFTTVRSVLLNPNAIIKYLGSNINLENSEEFSLRYKIGSSSVSAVHFTPNQSFSTGASTIVFYIYDKYGDPLANVDGIIILDATNRVVLNTISSITASESSITMNFSSPNPYPYTLYIIKENRIVSNGNFMHGSFGIYPPSAITPNTPTNNNLIPATREYLTYLTSDYRNANSETAYYNEQNIIIDGLYNNSVTFFINDIPDGYSIEEITFYQKYTKIPSTVIFELLNIGCVNLDNNSITVYFSSLEYLNNTPNYKNYLNINLVYYNRSTLHWISLTDIKIYINYSPILPTPNNNYTILPAQPIKPTVGVCPTFNLASPLSVEKTVENPTGLAYLYANTNVSFNISSCTETFDLSTYSFELGFIDKNDGNYYVLNSNLLSTSNTDMIFMELYEYNLSQNLLNPQRTSYSYINNGTLSLVLNVQYDICAAIRYPNPNGPDIIYETTNTIPFIFNYTPVPPPITPGSDPNGALISLAESPNIVDGVNSVFPVDGFIYTGINPYPINQGDTVNFFIYSPYEIVESIIVFNGYELSNYTKSTDKSNTYLGGSQSYLTNTQLSDEQAFMYPAIGGILYKYVVSVSIRMILPPDKYYIAVYTKTKQDIDGIITYNYAYSINNIYINNNQQFDLIVQGELINGVVIPPSINTENASIDDIGAYATINGNIILPPKSLYYYKNTDGIISTSGYFYVITGNTVVNNLDSRNIINGTSQNGVFCLEGQSYGKLINTNTSLSYNSIINNQLLYFKKLANVFGYGKTKDLEIIIDNKIASGEANIYSIIQKLELTARNIYYCGKYTTNIYIDGNSLPSGYSYYPNGVVENIQHQIPPSPNPKVNGPDTRDIYYSAVYYNEYYWGVYDPCNSISYTQPPIVPTGLLSPYAAPSSTIVVISPTSIEISSLSTGVDTLTSINSFNIETSALVVQFKIPVIPPALIPPNDLPNTGTIKIGTTDYYINLYSRYDEGPYYYFILSNDEIIEYPYANNDTITIFFNGTEVLYYQNNNFLVKFTYFVDNNNGTLPILQNFYVETTCDFENNIPATTGDGILSYNTTNANNILSVISSTSIQVWDAISPNKGIILSNQSFDIVSYGFMLQFRIPVIPQSTPAIGTINIGTHDYYIQLNSTSAQFTINNTIYSYINDDIIVMYFNGTDVLYFKNGLYLNKLPYIIPNTPQKLYIESTCSFRNTIPTPTGSGILTYNTSNANTVLVVNTVPPISNINVIGDITSPNGTILSNESFNINTNGFMVQFNIPTIPQSQLQPSTGTINIGTRDYYIQLNGDSTFTIKGFTTTHTYSNNDRITIYFNGVEILYFNNSILLTKCPYSPNYSNSQQFYVKSTCNFTNINNTILIGNIKGYVIPLTYSTLLINDIKGYIIPPTNNKLLISEIQGNSIPLTELYLPPKYWETTPNLPTGLITSTSPPQSFNGANTFDELNSLLDDNMVNYSVMYSTKNVIIIPSNYVGYGSVKSPSQPPYILTIHLNTNSATPPPSPDSCSCNGSDVSLNGELIYPGTEITIVNNSATNVRIVSFDLATSPPTPIQINLKDTIMDSLFIRPFDNMHLIFGTNSWSPI
jgi:hypothetical protein